MAAPFSSPEEIDQIVKLGNMDPAQAERAKAVYFPNYQAPIAAPQGTIAPVSNVTPAWAPTDGTLQPSTNMDTAVPAMPVANPNVQVPMAPQTKTESQSTRVAPGTLQGANAAVDMYAHSAKDLMEATAAHNVSQAELRASQAQENFKLVEANAAKRDLDNKDLEERRNGIRSEIDNLASQKVNSGRFYQNMGTGDKVMAAISVALGGFASAMQGKPGENAALSIIDKAVQRDIDEQMKNLDNARQVISLKDQDLSRLVQITGSKQAARDALMAKQYEVLAANLEAKAAKIPDPTIAARAQNLADQLKMSIAQKQMDVEKNVTQFTSATGGPKTDGTHLTADAAKNLGEQEAAIKGVKDLRKDSNKVGPFVGRIEGARDIAGTMSPETAGVQSKLTLLSTQLGKSVLGNLSESDKGLVLGKIMPKISDNKAAFEAKLDNVEKLLASRNEEERQSLLRAGFNVAPRPAKINEAPLGK